MDGVTKTPAEVALEPGSVYCLRVKETATDRDLEGQAVLARHEALVAVNLSWCEQITDAVWRTWSG